jgi:F-type H+-transporting ATPase subunit b
MAGKFVAGSMDEKGQAALIDETLKEMGDDTWLSK